MKRFLFFIAIALLLKLILTQFPDSVISLAFCRIPAEVAALYYGSAVSVENLSFVAKGVSLTVTRSCAGLDFFSLLVSVFVSALIVNRDAVWRVLPAIVGAFGATLICNAIRLIALVPAEVVFPKAEVPIVHLMVGASCFLPVFVGSWLWTAKERNYDSECE